MQLGNKRGVNFNRFILNILGIRECRTFRIYIFTDTIYYTSCNSTQIKSDRSINSVNNVDLLFILNLAKFIALFGIGYTIFQFFIKYQYIII